MAEAVKTIAEFLAVVRKSGLVEEARLAEAVAPWPDQGGELPPELPQALVDAELLTGWQIDQLRRGKHKGFMLGKYKLLRLLGAGGMSSVYLAENTTLRQRVALKVLPLKRVEQTSFLARFEREARTAFRLSHQNLARAFDLDSAGPVHFIVMEYIDGTDLHSLVKERVQEQGRPLDVREAVGYLRQAAVGLHYAHEEGLVHRDIKPANLMLDRKGTIKVLDLGLALVGDDDEQASVTREHDEKVLGTADYLAPEQAKDSHTADRRSDVYALGCTLYYLLVGRGPFAKGKLAERIQAHLNKQAPNLLDERPDVPPAIVDLYFRMMEKSPAARPQTAQEVADALGGWLAATAGSERVAPAPPPRRGASRAAGGGVAVAAPVFRSGPGSGGTSSVSLGGTPRPPAGAGKKPGPAPPVLRSGPGSGGTGPVSIVIGPPGGGGRKPATAPPRAKGAKRPDAEGEPEAKPRGRRRPLEFAGYPIGLWLALVGGLVAAIVLGTLVYLRNQ